jgi:hypothetical protein
MLQKSLNHAQVNPRCFGFWGFGERFSRFANIFDNIGKAQSVQCLSPCK